jgi:acyl dehydratase
MRQTRFKGGDRLPPLSLPPITRLDLALYCGASGDHNPLHVDVDAARAAALDDVIAHGMLSMAYLGRLLTENFDLTAITSFSVRFVAMTHVRDRLTCLGEVVEAGADGDDTVRIDLSVVDEVGEEKATGHARVSTTVERKPQ